MRFDLFEEEMDWKKILDTKAMVSMKYVGTWVEMGPMDISFSGSLSASVLNNFKGKIEE